jgi:hypothetical protein
MGFTHGLLDEGGGEGGISPDEVRNIDNLKVRSRCGEGGISGHGECKHLHDSTTNQVNFRLTGNVVGEESEASIGSITRIDLKVTLAEGMICQIDNCREFRAGGKGVQPDKDLMPGGTGCH